jgi:hypothetical protein
VREATNVIGVVATVGAAVLAYLSIRQTGIQSEKSARALIRERRIDFELDVLKEMAEILRAGTWP